jgi:hypothetical protein
LRALKIFCTTAQQQQHIMTDVGTTMHNTTNVGRTPHAASSAAGLYGSVVRRSALTRLHTVPPIVLTDSSGEHSPRLVVDRAIRERGVRFRRGLFACCTHPSHLLTPLQKRFDSADWAMRRCDTANTTVQDK